MRLAFRILGRLALLGPGALLGGCGGGETTLVAEPATIEFGAVPWRDVVERPLLLVNRSQAPVFVTELKPNCQCFSVDPFRRTIDPGETRRVTVRFESAKVSPQPLRGKKIDVVCDDPVRPLFEVPVEGAPFLTWLVSPESVDMGTLDDDARARTWTVHVRSGEGSSVVVQDAATSPPGQLVATIEPLASGGADVHVRLADGVAGVGVRFQGVLSLRLAVTQPDGSERRVTSSVKVEGDWP